MYKHSPVRNQRSKGIKIKHVVQVCLLIVVCFWLIFQVKRSYDKKKDFDGNNHKITHADDEIVKLGRKDLQPKLQETTQEQEDEEENKHEEDEDKIEESVDDENEQERSDIEIDRDEVDIIDEDKETEESGNDDQSETENRDEDGSTEHTHVAREEHYKADDASSAVTTTHDPEDQIKNKTLDDNSSENVGLVENDETTGQEKDSESVDSHENGPPPNTTTTSTADQFDSNSTMTENLTKNEEMLKKTGEENSYDQSKSEYLETNNEDSSDPTHLQEKDVRNDLETLPGIEAEGEDTASAE